MVEQEPCVLIVDDEQSDLERIKNALASIRLRVLTVSDPHEVLRKVESELPDLVILDALLPGLSGFDLCKQIKTEPETKNTAVVILTGVYLKDHYRREALHQFKADDFVTKPFRNRELQRLVLKLLAKGLQTSPKELQDSLTQSKDILLESELEEKPNWFGRIFGRLKGTPAQPAKSGFLHTAVETEVAEQPPEAPGEAVQGLETEEDGREAEIAAESKEAGVEAETEKASEEGVKEPTEVPGPAQEAQRDDEDDSRAEEEVKKTAEPDSPPQEVAPEAAAESVSSAELAAVEAEIEEVLADSESLSSQDSRIVDLPSAQVVFEALGNGRDADAEELEENATEVTMPAAARDGRPEVSEQPGGSEEPEVAPVETPESPPRPRALHDELPIYQEHDYLHELKREVSMCARLGRPITLIMVRIADLDQIAELLGRPFRSKVLFHVAEHALASLREVDMVGLLESKELLALTAFASDRYGGEKIVSRLQTILGHHPFEVGVGLPSFIPALRFGMAVYPKEAAGFVEMIERAETELGAVRRSD